MKLPCCRRPEDQVELMEKRLRRLIELRPDSAQAYNALGYSLADRKQRLPEAYRLIEKALSLSPEDYFILDSMGWVYSGCQGKRTKHCVTSNAPSPAMKIRKSPRISVKSCGCRGVRTMPASSGSGCRRRSIRRTRRWVRCSGVSGFRSEL